MSRALILLAISVGLTPVAPVANHQGWRTIDASTQGTINKAVRAVGIKAKAFCRGGPRDATVVLIGRERSGRFEMGVIIPGLYSTVPEGILREYRGPDTSRRASDHKAFVIELDRDGKQMTHRAAMLLVSTLALPREVKGDADEYFETIHPVGDSGEREWLRFLEATSSGFDNGRIVLGNSTFPDPVIVEFTGLGAGSLLQQFRAFIAPM